MPIYLRSELVPRLQKSPRDSNDVQVLVFRLGLGTSGTLGGGHIKPIAVHALIKAARQDLKALEAGVPPENRVSAEKAIDMYYGPLTELTHPNWGALHLGASLKMPPSFEVPPRFDASHMPLVIEPSSYILNAGGRAFDVVLQALHDYPLDLPSGEPEWPEGSTRN